MAKDRDTQSRIWQLSCFQYASARYRTFATTQKFYFLVDVGGGGMLSGILGYTVGRLTDNPWAWVLAGVVGLLGASVVAAVVYVIFWVQAFSARIKAAKGHIDYLERRPTIAFADSLILTEQGYLLAVTNCGPGKTKAYVSLTKVEWNNGSSKEHYNPVKYLRWQDERGEYAEDTPNTKEFEERETKYLHVFQVTGRALLNSSLNGFEGRFLAHNSKMDFQVIGLYGSEVSFEVQLFGNPAPAIAAKTVIRFTIPGEIKGNV